MSRLGRLTGVVLAGVAAMVAGCREIPAPDGGVLSISALRLPSPGLVAGDTLRDSLGVAAPLEVIAYGLDNAPLDPQPALNFVVLDTGAHLEGGRFLVGDTPGTTVRVVGAVAALQTLPVSIKVTLSPDSLGPADSTLHHVTYAFPPDTITQTTLNVNVLHRGSPPTPVDAVVVRYTIDRAPPSQDAVPAVLLLNGSVVSDRDTTESGRASRVARLRVLALSSFVEDTAIVSANASYRGASIGTVQFTLVFTRAASPAPDQARQQTP